MNKELSDNTTLSHYRIVSKLAEGGMGEVYLAEDTRLNRKVALKLLPAELAGQKERLKRFEQEAQAASALNHPNILTIHEFGTENSTDFIAMEFVEGVTLREKMASERLSINDALDIAAQVASALVKGRTRAVLPQRTKVDGRRGHDRATIQSRHAADAL